jgi:hypothetical protein
MVKRLTVGALGLALIVGLTTGCASSGYSQAEVEGTVTAAQTETARLLVKAPTARGDVERCPLAGPGRTAAHL